MDKSYDDGRAAGTGSDAAAEPATLDLEIEELEARIAFTQIEGNGCSGGSGGGGMHCIGIPRCGHP